MSKREEKLNNTTKENFKLFCYNPDNYLLIDQNKKSDLIIFAKHVKIIDQQYQVVPDKKSNFSVLKKAKQQNNTKAIQHEIRMLNLVGKSEAKAAIVIDEVKYIPMRFEGELNLMQAILSKKKLPLILNCLKNSIQNIKNLHEKNIMHMDIAWHNTMFPSGALIDYECSLEIDSKSGYAKLPTYLFGEFSISEQDDLPEKCFPFFKSGKKIISPIADCFLLADMLSQVVDLLSINYKHYPYLPFLDKALKETISTIQEADYRTNSVKLLEEIYQGFEFIVDTFLKLNNQPKMALFSQHNVKSSSTFIAPESGFENNNVPQVSC